jgi:hypothetical protein
MFGLDKNKKANPSDTSRTAKKVDKPAIVQEWEKKNSGKKKVVVDGPYAEAKDLVLGFIVVEARDLAQATELSMGCPMLDGSGSVEIRPVIRSLM